MQKGRHLASEIWREKRPMLVDGRNPEKTPVDNGEYIIVHKVFVDNRWCRISCSNRSSVE